MDRRVRPRAGECPRPQIALGEFYVTKPCRSPIRCVAYSRPPLPPYGERLGVLEPTTYLGPVRAVIHTRKFTAIQIERDPYGFVWVNVWAAKKALEGGFFRDVGTDYAWPVYGRRVPAGTRDVIIYDDDGYSEYAYEGHGDNGGPEPADAEAEIVGGDAGPAGAGPDPIYIGTPRFQRWDRRAQF